VYTAGRDGRVTPHIVGANAFLGAGRSGRGDLSGLWELIHLDGGLAGPGTK
jgi:hypothetical protein